MLYLEVVGGRKGVGPSRLGEELEAGVWTSLPNLTVLLYCVHYITVFKSLEHQSDAINKGPHLT